MNDNQTNAGVNKKPFACKIFFSENDISLRMTFDKGSRLTPPPYGQGDVIFSK